MYRTKLILLFSLFASWACSSTQPNNTEGALAALGQGVLFDFEEHIPVIRTSEAGDWLVYEGALLYRHGVSSSPGRLEIEEELDLRASRTFSFRARNPNTAPVYLELELVPTSDPYKRNVRSKTIEVLGHTEELVSLDLSTNGDFRIDDQTLDRGVVPRNMAMDLELSRLVFHVQSSNNVYLDDLRVDGQSETRVATGLPYDMSRGVAEVRAFGRTYGPGLRIEDGRLHYVSRELHRTGVVRLPVGPELSTNRKLVFEAYDALGSRGSKVAVLLKERDGNPDVMEGLTGDAWVSVEVPLTHTSTAVVLTLQADQFVSSEEAGDQGGNQRFELHKVAYIDFVFFGPNFSDPYNLDEAHFVLDNIRAEDPIQIEDPCAVHNGGCDALTTCTRTLSGRVCGACPQGFVGDGETGCFDIDECAQDNPPCDPLTKCVNLVGGWTCEACPPGYEGNGESGCRLVRSDVVVEFSKPADSRFEIPVKIDLSTYSTLTVHVRNPHPEAARFELYLGHRGIVSREVSLPGGSEEHITLRLDTEHDFRVDTGWIASMELDRVDTMFFQVEGPSFIEIKSVVAGGESTLRPDTSLPYRFVRGAMDIERFGEPLLSVEEAQLHVTGTLRRLWVVAFPNTENLSLFERLRVELLDVAGLEGAKFQMVLKEDDDVPRKSGQIPQGLGDGDAWASTLLDFDEGRSAYTLPMDLGHFRRSEEPEDQGGNGVFEPHRIGFVALVFFSPSFFSGGEESSLAHFVVDNLEPIDPKSVPDTCGLNHGGCDPLVECLNTPTGPWCGPCPPLYEGTGAKGCVPLEQVSLLDSPIIVGLPTDADPDRIPEVPIDSELSSFSALALSLENSHAYPVQFEFRLGENVVSRGLWLDARMKKTIVLNLDLNGDFELWNQRKSQEFYDENPDAVAMGLDVESIHFDPIPGGQKSVTVNGVFGVGQTVEEPDRALPYRFTRGVRGVRKQGPRAQLSVREGRLHFRGNIEERNVLSFPAGENLSLFQKLQVEVRDRLGTRGARFRVVLKENDGEHSSQAAGGHGGGDAWRSDVFEVDGVLKLYEVPLALSHFERSQDSDDADGNGQFELHRVQTVELVFMLPEGLEGTHQTFSHFVLDNLELVEPIDGIDDLCATNNGGCDARTACVMTPQGPWCGPCPDGYTGNGQDGCFDVDECLSGVCDALTECFNEPGGYRCGPCPGGFSGDGNSGCEDIDECAVDNGGCDDLMACHNRAGGMECGECAEGYQKASETTCIDVDECAVNHGGCDALRACINTMGGVECGPCPSGFLGDDAGTRCQPEAREPLITLEHPFTLDDSQRFARFPVDQDLSDRSHLNVVVYNPTRHEMVFRVDLRPKNQEHLVMRSRRFRVGPLDTLDLAVRLDSYDFHLWNEHPTKSGALVMDFDLSFVDVVLDDESSYARLDVLSLGVSGFTERRPAEDFPLEFHRGTAEVIALGNSLDDRGLELFESQIRYHVKPLTQDEDWHRRSAVVAFPVAGNLAAFDALNIRANDWGGNGSTSMRIVLKEDDGEPNLGEVLPRGDGWASRSVELRKDMETYRFPLQSSVFTRETEHAGGNGELEFHRVRWILVVFSEFYAGEGRTFGIESLDLAGESELFRRKVVSKEGIPVLGPSDPDVLVAYPSAELAIRHMNRRDFARAREILKPAAKAVWKGQGRLPRRYDIEGEPRSDDATNGDSSVMSIAFSRYIREVPDLDPYRKDEFTTIAIDSERLLQGWLLGEDSVDTLRDGRIWIDRPLRNSTFHEHSHLETFQPVRPRGEFISAENEIRRAMSLWFANKKAEAEALIREIRSEIRDDENNIFRSSIGGEDECSRDAFSLLVLALDGMELLGPFSKPELLEAARKRPCYTVDSNGLNPSKVWPWFGYQDAAIPEFMYLDASALAVLGLDDLAAEAIKATDRLVWAIGHGYSSAEHEEPSAITTIFRLYTKIKGPALNPYFAHPQ